MSHWKAAIERPRYTKNNDPKHYGFICPHCQARWGTVQSYIDVKRCTACPPFKDGYQLYWNVTKKPKSKKLGARL